MSQTTHSQMPQREVDLYPAIMRLFRRRRYAFAEVPYFGKRVDLLFATGGLRKLDAVESKIDDWRTALKQAALNQLFAQRCYVALPEAVGRRLADDDRRLFSRYHVGLIVVAEDAQVEIEAVRNGYFHLRDYRRVKKVLAAAMNSRSPKRLGAVADAIANGSRTLELLQTGPD